MAPLRPSPACFELIRKYETLSLKAYWDEDGWAVGYGHHGPEVIEGTVWTADQCEAALESDVQIVFLQILRTVDVSLTQGQADALVDFVYNEGIEHLQKSTLLRLLNASNYAGAAAQFLVWDYAGGVVNENLALRRQAEQTMFNLVGSTS